MNCVINLLTALHGLKNGQLRELKHMGQHINIVRRRILKEVPFVVLIEMELMIEGYERKSSEDRRRSTKEQCLVPFLLISTTTALQPRALCTAL